MCETLNVEESESGICATAISPGFVDTDMAASVTGPKHAPSDVARLAIDALAADAYEIVVDDFSRDIQTRLGTGVAALYPTLP